MQAGEETEVVDSHQPKHVHRPPAHVPNVAEPYRGLQGTMSASLNEVRALERPLSLERALSGIYLTACVTGSLPLSRISHDAISDHMQAQGRPVFFLG